MGKSSRGKKDVVAARLAKQRQRQEEFDQSPVEIARRVLADLDSAEPTYRLTYYAVDPSQLSSDLEVPIDGELHAHDDVLGKTIHLDESARRDSMTEASQSFTAPFIAVLRRPEDETNPVEHATIITGADMAREPLNSTLRIIMMVRKLERLDFAGLLGMSTNEGEWMASGPDEVEEITRDFQFRVMAEATLVSHELLTASGTR